MKDNKRFEKKIQELKELHKELRKKWKITDIDSATKENIDAYIKENLDQRKHSTIGANQNKVFNLKGGNIKYPTFSERAFQLLRKDS